jgi:hypothetical protein
MSGCIIKIATMNETIILELRGTGILLCVNSIENHDKKKPWEVAGLLCGSLDQAGACSHIKS